MALHCLVALDLSRDMKPGRYSDGGGLCLVVYRNRSRSWVFRYMLNGRLREMGLGSFNAIPLAEARKRASDSCLLKSEGTDPIEARRRKRQEAKLEEARALTFQQCAETYIEPYGADHQALRPRLGGYPEFICPRSGAKLPADSSTEM